MRAIGRLILLAILVPVVYVTSAAIYFPAVVWHRFVPPASSELMEIRQRAWRTADERPLRYDWVAFERISPHLVHAVLAAEDTRFYEHHGFDLEQIRRAWELNRRRGDRPLRGASTITQQTVKNLYLSPSRNLLRKAREAVLTGWMELWLPKERILELYLNIVELGPGVFGAQAASRAYFGGDAAELSRSDAALLAATLPAPLARNPDSPTRALHRRQRMILSRMGRWYEGPSLAEEEAVGAVAPEPLPPVPDSLLVGPETVESEPLNLEESLTGETPPTEAAAPADSARANDAPADSAPATASPPADSGAGEG